MGRLSHIMGRGEQFNHKDPYKREILLGSYHKRFAFQGQNDTRSLAEECGYPLEARKDEDTDSSPEP